MKRNRLSGGEAPDQGKCEFHTEVLIIANGDLAKGFVPRLGVAIAVPVALVAAAAGAALDTGDAQ